MPREDYSESICTGILAECLCLDGNLEDVTPRQHFKLDGTPLIPALPPAIKLTSDRGEPRLGAGPGHSQHLRVVLAIPMPCRARCPALGTGIGSSHPQERPSLERAAGSVKPLPPNTAPTHSASLGKASRLWASWRQHLPVKGQLSPAQHLAPSTG